MGNLFKKMLNSILKFLKKFWWVLVIIIIILAIYFPTVLPAIWAWIQNAWTVVTGWLGTLWSTVGSWASSAWTAAQGWVASASFGDVLKLAAGAAVLLDPEGVADGIGGIISDVVEAIPSAVWWGLGALAVWWLWPKGDDASNGSVMIYDGTQRENEEEQGYYG